jgi:hypothetical protein
MLAGKRGDAEIAEVAPETFEDAPILSLRAGGEIVEVGRADVADDYGVDAASARSFRRNLGACGSRRRHRFAISVHELVAADESGECNRFTAGLAEIVPHLPVPIAI